ncbi:MAG TPA: CBS domain-containing protein [Blastocatellia bacterium]|nr:CBS domain-containing protein [Blastocatellia bacterium]HMV86721.1 CBS domain-containing protein [Blastocatellia bacterium]HMX25121.1 CBS domain-containing protein [Blastocatellia bacterium]HMZ21492.1 CBS domain-containing protein [Blastocatellia bacterium]HNG33229.1 CBS domain-containing protein [Blastocatellia bacterium]
MPYEVSQLLNDIGRPVSARPDEPIQDALNRMLHHGFSQLPVVKSQGQSRLFYFITHESILIALHNFGCKIEDSGLRVEDALVRVPNVYRATDDLFELLAGMRETNAVLIVDDDRNLTHVVTSYDTTRYFRQWAEDIMQVRDIEHGLRRIINSVFKKSDGELDEQARQAAVEEITSSNKTLRKKFGNALRRYLTQQATKAVTPMSDGVDQAFLELLNGCKEISASDGNNPTSYSDASVLHTKTINQESVVTSLLGTSQTIRECFEMALKSYLTQQASVAIELDELLVDEAFRLIYDRNEQVKEFSELTLGEYIQLFFKDACWQRCQGVIKLKQEEVKHMLEGVRDTRNDLAHFRESEITAQKRLQLKRCADWLSERENLIIASFVENTSSDGHTI